MSKWLLTRGICVGLLLLGMQALVPTPVGASHGWLSYHWRKTSSSILNIPVRRYHSAAWVTRYNTAMTDWRNSAMTKIKPFTFSTAGPKSTWAACPTIAGGVSSCDGSYGTTGFFQWFGLAQVFTSSGHVTAARSWVNNSFLNVAPFNTVAWRQAVICQEIGHTFGLGHVNENFYNANTGSCMDYTARPAGSATEKNNMHPNSHDYALINSRHSHIGSLIPGLAPQRELEMPPAMMAFAPTSVSELGALVHVGDGGRTARYERDFGNGFKVTTFMIRSRAR